MCSFFFLNCLNWNNSLPLLSAIVKCSMITFRLSLRQLFAISSTDGVKRVLGIIFKELSRALNVTMMLLLSLSIHCCACGICSQETKQSPLWLWGVKELESTPQWIHTAYDVTKYCHIWYFNYLGNMPSVKHIQNKIIIKLSYKNVKKQYGRIWILKYIPTSQCID